MLREEILREWNDYKQKLLTAIHHLQTEYKDKRMLVNYKSNCPPIQIKVLTPTQLAELKRQIQTQQSSLKNLENRRGNNPFSPPDQIEYDQLAREIAVKQKQLTEQEQLRKSNHWEPLRVQAIFKEANQEKEKYFQQLLMANERYDRLMDKLIQIKELIKELIKLIN